MASSPSCDDSLHRSSNCDKWTDEDLVTVVADNVKPGWWTGDCQVCYCLLSKFFEVSVKCDGSQRDVVTRALLTLEPNITIPAHLKNLKRKAIKFIQKKPSQCAPVSELYTKTKESIGQECDKNNVTITVLRDILKGTIENLKHEFGVISLNNKMILELNDARQRLSASWSDFVTWVIVLGRNNSQDSHTQHILEPSSVRLCVGRLVDKQKELSKRKEKLELELLLNKTFTLPLKRPKQSSESDLELDQQVTLEKQEKELEELVACLEQSTAQVEELSKKIEVQSEMHKANNLRIVQLRTELQKMISLHDRKSKQLQSALEKLGQNSTRNVNKRIKRRDEMNAKLNVKIKEMKFEMKDNDKKQQRELNEQTERYSEIIDEKNDIIAKLNTKLDAVLHAKSKAQKLKWYHKTKAQMYANKSSEGHLFSKIKELKARIVELENDVAALEEKIHNFLDKPIVKTFQNGRYTDDVRSVYEDLLCWGVGVENVEKVIQSVLENLAGLKCERLPKATFARYMYLEARRLAQIQVADTLLNDWESGNRTLHSDATSKHGYQYGTFDLTMDDGNILVAGMRDMGDGTAEGQFEVLREVLSDIAQCIDEKDMEKKALKSIKNLMSDRCIVQKKFNEILQSYRQTILPEVVEGWSSFSDDEKAKMSRMNDLFCGLHFIVGLADQAEGALKVWDKLLYGDAKIGSLAHGGYSKGESGTLRLVRTVCKAVQAKGCEKSGRAVSFFDFVRDKGLLSVPLAPFRGNRFNILFYNGGGVFFIVEHLKSFIEWMKDENRLLKAVHHDLEVLSFLAGCRALGLINKFVTGPLWRVLAKADVSALGMSEHYQMLMKAFSKYANDATPLLHGDANIFGDDYIKKDECYVRLTEVNPTLDMMTKQVLELIFGSFVVVTRRMLCDHLEGGKYDKPADWLNEECKNAPKTNVAPERDFGMLDRLLVQKPNSTMLVLEGIVMFTKNSTKSWRDSLEPEKKAVVMAMARNSKQSQRQEYTTRQAKIRKVREERLMKGKEEKEKRELKSRIRKQHLVEKIEQEGGHWKAEDVDKNVCMIKGEKEKRSAIKLQIDFQRYVLGATFHDKKVFQLSSGGRIFSSQEMAKNLKSIIEKSNEDCQKVVEDVAVLPAGIQLVPQEILSMEKKKYSDMAEKEILKAGQKRKAKDKITGTAKHRKHASEDQDVPTIVVPEDLIGKKVSHYCYGDEGNMSWFDGTVVGIHGKNAKEPDYLIRYDGYDDLFIFSYDEWKQGSVKLLSLTAEDFLGKQISQRFEDTNHENSWWENGRVLNATTEKGTEFVVEFDGQVSDEELSDDIAIECELCVFDLFEEYLNNDLKFI